MKGNYKIYKDSLGQVLVPKDKYWGATTQRSYNNFKIGDENMPKEIIKAYATIKKCSARANFDFGLLDKDKLDAIEKVCDEIKDGKLDEHFPLKIWQTGSGTHTNMNLNEVIANRALEIDNINLHPNDDVNKSQSSNDTFPTAIKIATYELILETLLPTLSNIAKSFYEKSKQFKNIVKSGRTHLMDAAPITLGQEFSGYCYMIQNTAHMIEISLQKLLELPLGGTAVGTGLNTVMGYQQKVVDLIAIDTSYYFCPTSNNFHGLTSMDAIVNVFGSIKALALNLIKIANDLRLLSSGPNTSISEITLPANEPGSSIMPGKINPTQIEALIMVCYQVIGFETTVSMCASAGILELNVCQPLVAYDIIKSIKLLSDALISFESNCLSGIKPNIKNIEKHLSKNQMLITSLNKIIGYDKASEITKLAQKENISIKQAASKLGYVNENEFDKYVDPKRMCQPND